VREENSLWRQVIVEKYGSKEGVGVQRKLKGHTSIFGGILKRDGVILLHISCTEMDKRCAR